MSDAHFWIVVPFYNGMKYFEYNIRSLVDQTYANVKILVIDDCSEAVQTRQLKALLDQVNDSRIEYVRNHKNQGLMRSLNHALKYVDSKYFFILGQDDVVEKRHVESFHYFLKNMDVEESAGPSMVFCDAKYIRGLEPSNALVRGKKISRFRKNMELKYFRLMYWNYVVSTGILLNTDTLKSVGGFCTDYKNHGEWLTWIRLARVGKVKINYGVNSWYRRHQENITNSMFSSQFYSTFRYYNHVAHYAYRVAPGRFHKYYVFPLVLIRNLSLLFVKNIKLRVQSL
ncbi:glycosyltransferase family A protein [Marinobacter halophilus]|uniref:Glycosyltransferase 2-like domain-containing protein n=1 Tax=Marinobacter halophilus TaxID=1323740 RepID=A0A2T1KDC7_9GAMM|nr:glycosyltransferase family 2 protein [Marinobacter halophilus]PSF07763.1 hypothetical protein C7H08_10130 [Marinobacter halophilus]GGC56868.1 hypothetical protein GCM10011362_01530 [Marinobacter halophilus]